MLLSIIPGFLAGALHVLSGADHLVAMAPSVLSQPKKALRNGFSWGLGHSAGVLMLSLLAILVKDLASIEQMSYFAEFSVGIALLVIGVLAIRSCFRVTIHTHSHSHSLKNLNGNKHDHVHLHYLGQKKHNRHTHAATTLGLLHGLAGASHLIAVIPALALPFMGAISYMAAYLIGSIIAMGVFVIAVSFASLNAGRRALPLIIGSTGGMSVVTGCFWMQKTLGHVF